MIVDFKTISEVVVPHARGGEKEFIHRPWNDDKVKIMMCRLAPGASIGPHVHETNCEVFYFLEGSGKVVDNGTYVPVCAGQSQYCPKGNDHGLINDGDVDLVFFAVIAEQ